MDTKRLNGVAAMYNRRGISVGWNFITVRLSNGSNLCIDVCSSSDMINYFGIKTSKNGIVIHLDVNGDSGPNVIGKDIFVLGFTDKGIVPGGNDKTINDVNQSCKSGGEGYLCMKKVKDNGWVIPDDVWNHKF
jgi:hypothetical protein